MDRSTEKKFRALGAIIFVLVATFLLVAIFMQNKEKKDTSIKLKVLYSDMNSALNYAKITNGQLSYWGLMGGYKNTTTLNNNIFNNMNIEANCTIKQNNCFPETNYKSIKKKQTNINPSQYPSVRLKNGASISIETISNCKYNETCAILYLDINGIEKPNALGKDLFVFTIINTDGNLVKPYGHDLPKDKLLNDTKYGCNKNSEAALYCGAYILKNNWKINKKYPW